MTRAERNRVRSSPGSPRSSRLQDCATEASDDDRELIRHGLHVGLVVDEHQVEFGRGDFLVRNVLGADPTTGALAVGDEVSVGQTVQFHVRDAAAADEDLRALLGRPRRRRRAAVHLQRPRAALLRHARPRRRRRRPAARPAAARGRVLRRRDRAGRRRNFLHGFTASVALFGS